MEELVRIAEKYNIDLIRFTRLLSFGRAVGKDLTINQVQYIDFLKKASSIKSDTVKIVYPNQKHKKIWVGTNGFGFHCGKEAIWIDEVGNVSPCIFWGEKYNIGNIKDTDYMTLWNKSLSVSQIEGNDICKNCKNYKLCRGGCRAIVLFDEDNLDGVDPLCPLKKNM